MISSCLRSMSQHTCGLVMDLLATMCLRDRGRRFKCGARPFDRLLEISLVHLDADETQSQLGAGDGSRAESEERVGHQAGSFEAIHPEAHLRQLWWKRRRMR